MAEAKDNFMTKGLSGTIARLVTFRQKAGKTILAKLRRKTLPSQKESAIAAREKFLKSAAYAKLAIKNDVVKEMYRSAAKPGRTAYNVALADAIVAPQILGIDTTGYHGVAGDPILVTATDNFKVAGVKVSVFTTNGALLEEGNAVMQENDSEWLYKATSANADLAGLKITAVAADLPGNQTTFSKTL